jgi:hypothetical protein
MEATDMEANPEEIWSKLEHQEVPKEEATVETIRALEDQYGDRHLAVRCRPKMDDLLYRTCTAQGPQS